jgi:hypothetical protein
VVDDPSHMIKEAFIINAAEARALDDPPNFY